MTSWSRQRSCRGMPQVRPECLPQDSSHLVCQGPLPSRTYIMQLSMWQPLFLKVAHLSRTVLIFDEVSNAHVDALQNLCQPLKVALMPPSQHAMGTVDLVLIRSKRQVMHISGSVEEIGATE